MGNKGACALYEEEVEMPNPEKFDPGEVVKYEDNKIYYNDGSWYQGDVDESKPNGSGKYIRPDNTYYEGEWKDGLPHGRGREVMFGNDEYEGDYIQGYKHGKGQYTFASKPYVYVGDFDENSYCGQGTMYWFENQADLKNHDTTNASTYQGGWRDNKYEGNGVYTCKKKNQVLECEYANGMRNGKGKLTFQDNAQYEGFWNDNEPVGAAVLRTRDGKQVGFLFVDFEIIKVRWRMEKRNFREETEKGNPCIG